MASQIFNVAKAGLLSGAIDLDSNTIKAALLMTNTTADTDNDAISFVGDFGTLDECDAAGYARVSLGSKVVNQDNTNDRGAFDAADSSFTGLGGDATRDIQGVLIYKHVTNDADSIPIAFIDFTSDIPKTATQIDIPWASAGILLAA